MAYSPNNSNGQKTSANSAPVVIASDQSSVHISGTSKTIAATTTSVTCANLQSLSSSATVGWQSARISTSGYNDFEIFCSLTFANTAPANDKSAYIYLAPWFFSGSTYFASSIGTTTLPSNSDTGCTIASPNNLRLACVLNYSTAQATCQDTFLLSNVFGQRLPDAFSLVLINYTGAATSTGCVIYYTPINDSTQ